MHCSGSYSKMSPSPQETEGNCRHGYPRRRLGCRCQFAVGQLCESRAATDDGRRDILHWHDRVALFIHVRRPTRTRPTQNTFWLALEAINGPTLVLAEATVGSSTYLLGAYSPWEFDRNVVVPGPGQGSPGRYFVEDPAARDAVLMNFTTNTVIPQTGCVRVARRFGPGHSDGGRRPHVLLRQLERSFAIGFGDRDRSIRERSGIEHLRPGRPERIFRLVVSRPTPSGCRSHQRCFSPVSAHVWGCITAGATRAGFGSAEISVIPSWSLVAGWRSMSLRPAR